MKAFLRFGIVLVEERMYTIHEVLDQLAHIDGGVHSGSPKTLEEQILAAWGHSVQIEDQSGRARFVRSAASRSRRCSRCARPPGASRRASVRLQ